MENPLEDRTKREVSEKDVRTALGEPFSADFNDYTRKLRMNLIVASFIALIIVYAHVSILPSSTFFGLTFRGLTDRIVLIALLLVNVYTSLHFLWCSYDHVLEFILRQSGSRVAFQTGSSFGHPHVDYPKNPRQSTLYNWWIKIGRDLPDLKNGMEKVLADFDVLQKQFNETKPETTAGAADVAGQINGLRLNLGELTRGIEKTIEVMDSPRITVSLSRFDGAFRRMLQSQNLRWLIFELGIPAVMGILAITMLSMRIAQGAGLGWLSI
jgi:hypothetical protein